MTTPLPPNDPPSADEPLPGEAELAALYRELPRSEPSPALDAAVLRAAAAALAPSGNPTVTERRKGPREPGDWVHPKPVSAVTAKAIPSIDGAPRRRRAPPWLITLGSAASLVLVAGLAWQLRESGPPPSAPAAAREATAPTVSNMARHEVSAPLAGTVAPAAQPAPRLADQRAALQASAAKKMKQDSAVQSARLQSARRAAAAKPMAAPPPLAEVAAPAPQVQYAPPPPPAPPAPPAPPPPAPLQEASANAAASDAFDKSAQPVAPSAASSDQATAARPGDTPAQELDKIRQLFAQGHHDEALQRLRAFRQTHPQWPLPAELQAQLQEP
ncbi:hypothetical protein ASD55_08155 [Rhodanobacter sp. Root561]|uniref:hypothetical protein n=1 Tax=Rhodanobacter sp. Root561 TaxID=1736560 RepID=UPI0006FE47BF|nr:hypothetical protein [Rhodanobacter sp. Root561]KQZ77816.1 hypothetical protein ASD55_08155 [Rhodanobacter sp. Root561]